jgi:hypothetical protein
MWVRQYAAKSSHEPGMGIKFLDLAPNIRKKIDDWVKKGPKG